MNKFILTAFSLLLLSTISSGQEITRKFTLEEALQRAQEESPDALNAKQAFRSSYWDYRSYQASNLPALIFSSTLPYINQSIQSQSIDGVQKYSSYKYVLANAKLALTQKIGITGGTISVNSSLQGQFNADQANPTPYWSTPINIEFDQPLFAYNSFRWDRKIKPLKYKIAERKYYEDLEQIAITATNYFFNLLQAQVDKTIADTNRSNYETLYHIALGRYQLGKIAENDLLQLQLSFLKAQAQVENAQLALDNARFRFKSYLRVQDETDIVLLPPDNINFFKIDPAVAREKAKLYSTTTYTFTKRKWEAASAINKAKLDGRFDANLMAVIGLQQNGLTVADAYQSPADQRQVALGMTIPIYDWGVARGNIKVAEAQEEIELNNIEQEAIDFDQNVYQKAIQCNMQQNQVHIALQSAQVAKKSYEVTKGRYLIGKINSILDLNNAQMETDNAEKGYYYALQTYWRSLFELRKMTLFDFSKNVPILYNFPGVK